MGTKLIDLWASSALIQGIMAVSSLGAIIYLSVVQATIPDVLVGVVMAIIGFYFGQKNAINRTSRAPPPGGDTWHE